MIRGHECRSELELWRDGSNITLVCYKAMDRTGSGTVNSIASGINWAADFARNFSNTKVGSTSHDDLMRQGWTEKEGRYRWCRQRRQVILLQSWW
jgi:hypothetical protein